MIKGLNEKRLNPHSKKWQNKKRENVIFSRVLLSAKKIKNFKLTCKE